MEAAKYAKIAFWEESMNWTNDRIEWEADGKPIRISLTRFGSGPSILMLPAISSISTREEIRPLQEALGASFATTAIDWPGFGDLSRPSINWRPDLYQAFLRFVLANVVEPSITVAAGHAAGYALAQAANDPASIGRLCLLSPTWRGPLPTMTGQRLRLFKILAKAVDLPFAGALLYRLNVNGPIIGMMARGHVYEDSSWLTPERLAVKRAVTEAPGARHASFRFVAGELDLFTDRGRFLKTASRVANGMIVLYGRHVPRKSKAEMAALGSLSNVKVVELPRGKLNFYEEFSGDAAFAINESLARSLF